jgi:hypothetical protein
MESFEYAGYWWLPSDEGTKVPGTVRFSQEAGIELSLLGSFKPVEQMLTSPEYELVLGLTEEGKVFTLFDCLETNSRMTAPGFVTQRLYARLAFMGAHFSSTAGMRFTKATTQYTYLADWAGVTGFTPEWETEGGQLAKFHMTYSYPDEVKSNTSYGELALTYGFESKGDVLSDMALRQSIMFRLHYTDETSIDDVFTKFVTPMQNFLTLATGSPNAVVELVVYSRANVRVSKDGSDRPLPIEVFFQRLFDEPTRERRLTPDRLLFALSDITADFDAVMKSWLDVASELSTFFGLLFGFRYAPFTYVQQRFLNVAQAVETYHRARKHGSVMDQAEFDSILEAVVAATPEPRRDWLKQRLQHGNEPSLRRRVRELYNSAKDVMEPVAETEKFVATVVNTRNYHTHYSPELKDIAATEPTDLMYLVEKLRILAESSVLEEVGINGDRRLQLFKRNRNYNWVCSLPLNP